MRTDRKEVGLRGWRDRDGGKDDRRGDAGAPPGPEQEATRRIGAADRDDAGRARRQPDGLGGLAAAGGRAAGHALPVDQPAPGRRADRGRGGDGPYGREILAHLAANGRKVVLMIDQTRATGRRQVVMVAARVGERALPLAWRVKATEGAIGFPERREALEAAS